MNRRAIVGWLGALLFVCALLLALVGHGTLGWLVLAIGSFLVAFSIFTGSRPFLEE